jgi:hypothetical protein
MNEDILDELNTEYVLTKMMIMIMMIIIIPPSIRPTWPVKAIMKQNLPSF